MRKRKYDHEFTIDRSKWANGFTRDIPMYDNSLLNGDGSMCCMGFACHSYGVPKKFLKGVGTPSRIIIKHPSGFPGELPEWFLSQTLGVGGTFEEKAVELNDSLNKCLKEKEKAIADLFAQQNVKVKFKGKYK